MAGLARKMDGGNETGLVGFVRKVARTFERGHNAEAVSVHSDGIEIVAEDFDRIVQCIKNPPKPSEAIIKANELHRELLARR